MNEPDCRELKITPMNYFLVIPFASIARAFVDGALPTTRKDHFVSSSVRFYGRGTENPARTHRFTDIHKQLEAGRPKKHPSADESRRVVDDRSNRVQTARRRISGNFSGHDLKVRILAFRYSWRNYWPHYHLTWLRIPEVESFPSGRSHSESIHPP